MLGGVCYRSDRIGLDRTIARPLRSPTAAVEAAKHLVLSNCEPKHIFLEYACTTGGTLRAFMFSEWRRRRDFLVDFVERRPFSFF